MVLMGYSGARGTLIYEKNLKSKISCQTPFKRFTNTGSGGPLRQKRFVLPARQAGNRFLSSIKVLQIKLYYIGAEPIFVNFYGVEESIPSNQFRQAGNRFLGSIKGLQIWAQAT